VVLDCADVERSLAWYCDRLGLAPERVDEWRRGEVFFPSVRVDATTVIDLFPSAGSGENMNHLCLVVEADLDEVASSGRFDVVSFPSEPRWGARGEARSIYVRDPDGNVVELRVY
jgi:catechol 2,3-dioxygenase-like lactoylglutathione lyase family enzyme